jgi:mannose-6-phosphate isomerase-like protein (cupin superfamily)
LAGEHLEVQARRVVSGFDEYGKSTIVADAYTTRRVAMPAFTVCDIWETQSLPVPIGQDPAEGEVTLLPPTTGFTYRVTTFPPDSETDPATFGDSLGGMGGEDAHDEAANVPGMHVHETVDIVTVVSGEVHVVLEAAETLLKQGDTVILRGAMHAWSNRSNKPCTVTSLMMGATP